MSEPSFSAARRAACIALGIPDDATPDRVRAAFLAHLAASDFCALPLQVEAATFLAAISPFKSVHPALDRATERHLSTKIELFADGYWKHEPAQRRENWESLMEASASFPRLAGRLCDLDHCLDLALPAEIAEPAAQKLLAALQELYPLKPAQRAARRANLLSDIGTPAELGVAALALRTGVTQISRIDRGLIEMLLGEAPSAPTIRIPDSNDRYRTEPPGRKYGSTHSNFREPVDESQRPSTSQKSTLRWGWVVAICVTVCGGFFRGFGTHPRSDSNSIYTGDYARTTDSLPGLVYSPRYPPKNIELDLLQTQPPAGGATQAALRPGQRMFVVSLGFRGSITDAEAQKFAEAYVKLSAIPDHAAPFDAKANEEWMTAERLVFTPEQSKMIPRFASTTLSKSEAYLLIKDFVKAGRK